MSWHNSNNPSRRPPPDGRRPASQPDDSAEYSPFGQTFSSRESSAAPLPAAPLPRMIAAARERLASSNRERINSILGDSPYTTRRWTPAPGESAPSRPRVPHQTVLPSRYDMPTLPSRYDVRLPSRFDMPPGESAPPRPRVLRPGELPSRYEMPPPIIASPLSMSPLSGDFVSQTQSPHPNRMTSLEQLDRTLDEANAHLRALLDMTSANSVSRQLIPMDISNFTQPTRTHDFTYDNQRSKRRKVDGERYTHDAQTFRYGYYGQVEAGDLEMEMVSCDGGMFSNELSYAAENILKNDNSVYCTKGNRCNIVLRHRGSTAFTLSELVIKAPKSMNYSHPVREGMVFITMDQDEVLHRTAQYQIQYAPNTGTGSRDHVTFTNTDPRTRFNREPQHTISISHNRDGTSTTRRDRSYIYGPGSNDTRTPHMPREFTASQPDFRISTEFSDDDDDDAAAAGNAAPVSILRRPPPNRIGSLPFESDDVESDSDLESGHITNAFLTENTIRRLRRGDSSAAAAARYNPNTATTTNIFGHDFENYSASANPNPSSPQQQRQHSSSLAQAWDAHANATQEAIRAVGGDALLAPHARFHIEKKKSKCTIRFDPPVSGRFILLKMWSSHHDPGSNIDIQTVMARGFAGPRYFPAVEMR